MSGISKQDRSNVYLVVDTDENYTYGVFSTYPRAWKWIKGEQIKDILRRQKQGWTERQLRVSRQYFEDPKNLHPYDIEEKAIDEPNEDIEG